MPHFSVVRESILSAPDEREARRLISEALSSVTVGEVASLPIECRWAIVTGSLDFHSAAVELLQCDLKYNGDETTGDLLHQMAELFACASVRFSQLQQYGCVTHGGIAGGAPLHGSPSR